LSLTKSTQEHTEKTKDSPVTNHPSWLKFKLARFRH